MKKLFLFYGIAVFILLTQCSPNEIEVKSGKQIDPDKVKSQFKDEFSKGFKVLNASSVFIAGRVDNKTVGMTYRYNHVQENLKKSFYSFVPSIEDKLTFIPDYTLLQESNYSSVRQENVLMNLLDTTTILSLNQKIHLFAIVELIMVEKDLDELRTELAEYFEDEIIANQSLSEEQKLPLIELVAGVEETMDLLERNDINYYEKIYAAIDLTNEQGGRMDCSVNTRNVLLSGVVGFTGGFISGAWAGATAGTVTFPVIGTVVGGVSGGIISGAVGFAGGVSSAVFAELLGTCLRGNTSSGHSSYSAASCRILIDRLQSGIITADQLGDGCWEYYLESAGDINCC